ENEFREGILATEQFMRGKLDKKEFFKKKRGLNATYKLMCPLDLHDWNAHFYARQAAYLASLAPLSPTNFAGAGDQIRRCIVESQVSPRRMDHDDPEWLRLNSEVQQQLAWEVLAFLKKTPHSGLMVRSLLD